MAWTEERYQQTLEKLKTKRRQVIVQFGEKEIEELEYLESHEWMGKYIKDLIREDMKKNGWKSEHSS